MKQKFYLLLLMALVSSVSYAQLKVGPIVNAGLTNYYSSGDKKGDTSFDYAAGAVVSYELFDMLTTSAEFRYVRSSMYAPVLTDFYSSNSPILNDISNSSFHSNSIDIPFKVGVKFMELGLGNLGAYLGGSWRYQFNTNHNFTRRVTSDQGFVSRSDYQNDISDRFIYHQWSLIGGVFLQTESNINIDLRYRHGLDNLSNVESNPYYYQRGIYLSVSYSFDVLDFGGGGGEE